MAITLNNLGAAPRARGDHAGAGRLFEASLALRRELGDKRGIALGLKNLGDSARYLSDYDRAAALYQESLALRRELGDPWGLALQSRGTGPPSPSCAQIPSAERGCPVSPPKRQTVGAPLRRRPARHRGGVSRPAREALGPRRFEWNGGLERHGIDDALEFAPLRPRTGPRTQRLPTATRLDSDAARARGRYADCRQPDNREIAAS